MPEDFGRETLPEMAFEAVLWADPADFVNGPPPADSVGAIEADDVAEAVRTAAYYFSFDSTEMSELNAALPDQSRKAA